MGCSQLRQFNRIDSKSDKAMSSSFPQIVLEQAQIDAEVGRRLNPDRNAVQRAQDFLRDQLSKRVGGPQKGVRTPQQQTDFDAEVGRRLTKQQQKANRMNNSDIARAGTFLSGLVKPTSIFTALATSLTSDSDQTNKWRRLGYPSAQAYDQAMQKVRDKGIDPTTGRKLVTATAKTSEEKLNQDPPSDPDRTEVETSTLEKNRPTDFDGGIDTRTGTKFENFQAQQQDLMDRRAGLRTPYSAEGVDIVGDVDPRTAALIRGIPRDPFSSTQLPLTELFSENAPQYDIGIDPSKMLERAKNINFSETAEGLTDFSKTLGLRDAYSSNYVSPVNFNAMQSSGDPMLNPDIDVATAMQMKNRDAGLMYASGQFFAEGEGGQPVLVNRQLAKDVRSGKKGAQAQLDAYLASGGIRPEGSEKNPGFGIMRDLRQDEMYNIPKVTAEQIENSGYSPLDAMAMGVPEDNAKAMGQGDYVQYYNELDFDKDKSNGTLVDGGITPFTRNLLR